MAHRTHPHNSLVVDAMPRRPRYVRPCLLLVALMLSVLIACGGETAQDFQVELFDGQRFRLSEEYGDSVVVINFWYPSCAPCREEMPEFQKAWEDLAGKPVRFLGVFVPGGFDNEHSAREFVDQLELEFSFATDHSEAIATAYGIELFPTTWFIDRGGRVAVKHAGALDADRIGTTVRELIDG